MGSLGWADRSGGYSSEYGLGGWKITPVLVLAAVGSILLATDHSSESHHASPTVDCVTTALPGDTYSAYTDDAHMGDSQSELTIYTLQQVNHDKEPYPDAAVKIPSELICGQLAINGRVVQYTAHHS